MGGESDSEEIDEVRDAVRAGLGKGRIMLAAFTEVGDFAASGEGSLSGLLMGVLYPIFRERSGLGLRAGVVNALRGPFGAMLKVLWRCIMKGDLDGCRRSPA
jgi:hypothetical protein